METARKSDRGRRGAAKVKPLVLLFVLMAVAAGVAGFMKGRARKKTVAALPAASAAPAPVSAPVVPVPAQAGTPIAGDMPSPAPGPAIVPTPPVPSPPAGAARAAMPGSQPGRPAPSADADAEERAERVAKIYAAMPPPQASAALQALSEDEAVKIMGAMTERQAGKLLGQMDPKRVAAYTRKMSIPETQR